LKAYLMNSKRLGEIYNLLYQHFGPQGWWPGESTEEIILGAILTQNTSWGNVEKALAQLKGNNCLDFEKIYDLDTALFAEMIRPAGYYNIKAKRVKNFVQWLYDQYAGQLGRLESVSTDLLRNQLLSVNGIGKETADSILLYGLGRAVFVVDTYTSRVLVRHNLIDDQCDYEQIREFMESNTEENVQLYNEFHALLVCVGKQFCKPRCLCSKCPLDSIPHASLDNIA